MVAGGCVLLGVSITVRSDGSFERRVVAKFSRGNKALRGTGPKSAGLATFKPEEAIKLPKGNGWKVEKVQEESETHLSAIRTFQAGETSSSLPGRIVGHNCQLDPFTGEVFWPLYPEAAAVGDVELVAVSEIGK